MNNSDKIQIGYDVARRINRKCGKSYYWATQLFPAEKRRATYALYAFFRIADDIVDAKDITTVSGQNRARRELDDYRNAWDRALLTGDAENPAICAAAYVCSRYGIPREHSELFLNSMAMDITCGRYDTYADLSRYMDGSAAAVGLMMSYVIGFTDPSALPHLANLGNAMQLTNFLRDVDEDYHDYHRVYIPIEDLDTFGLGEADIAARRYSAKWRAMMEFEASRTHDLYADAEHGIDLLSSDVKWPIRVASALYSAILVKLREKNWNVFAGRAHTNTFEKLILTLQVAKRR